MKQINLQETTASQGGSGLSKIQEVGSQLYIPNYKGVNQILYKAEGDGTIAFNDALAANGRKELDNFIKVNTALKGADSLISIDTEMNKASEEHLKSAPDGEGYTLAMTSKYKALVEEHSSNAPTDDIRDYILLNSKNGLKDWGNKSFRTESIRKSSFYEAGIRENKDVLRNKIVTSPELYESLTPAYISQVEAMKDDPNVDFAKYQKESMDEWDTSYVYGLIKKDPNQTLELLKNGNLVAKLDPDKRTQLINASVQQIEHNEYRAYIAQKNGERALDRVRQINNSRLDLMRAEGTLSQNDLDIMYKNGQIDEMCYNRQAYKIIKDRETGKKNSVKKDAIIESQLNKTPTFGISTSDKDDFLFERFRMDQAADPENKYPNLTLRLNYVYDNQVTFDYEMPHFKNEIETMIKVDKDSKQVIDGVIALNSFKNLRALKGIDPLLIDFSDLAISTLKSGDVQSESIVKLRDEWFNKDKDLTELRNKEWKQTDYYKKDKKMSALKRLYENSDIGYGGFLSKVLPFFSDRIPAGQEEVINAKVLSKLEAVYKQTGSLAKAEVVASEYIKNMFTKTDINGEDELMFNAPTKDRTKLEDYATKNIIRAKSEEIVDELSKMGVPISKRYNFLKTKNTNYKTLLNKPNLSSSLPMKVNVLIGGKKAVRKLYYESVSDMNRNAGNLFYYFDEENKRGKEYLLKPNSNNKYERFTIDLDDIIKQNG